MSTWLNPRVCRYLTKHDFWVCLEGCFWMKLAFAWLDSVKLFSFYNVASTMQSVVGLLNRTKRYRKEESDPFFLPLCLSWDIDLLSCWLPFIKILDSVWIIPLTYLGAQLQMIIMGLVSLHNFVNKFLIIDPFVYLYTHMYVYI